MTSPKALSVLAIALLFASPALAKDARCFTTDDGEYPCWFEFADDSGSFTITAPGYPKFELVVESPGVAWVYGTYDGSDSVALPGPYYRSDSDGGCWQNPDTETEICAW